MLLLADPSDCRMGYVGGELARVSAPRLSRAAQQGGVGFQPVQGLLAIRELDSQ